MHYFYPESWFILKPTTDVLLHTHSSPVDYVVYIVFALLKVIIIYSNYRFISINSIWLTVNSDG
jgi:hypothetical protein